MNGHLVRNGNVVAMIVRYVIAAFRSYKSPT
jgi:hypothetical protein